MNAFDYVASNRDWTLVHGICILTGGPHVGEEFGHAWAEKGETVYDAASGKSVPKVLYYAFGNVGYTVRYSWTEAQNKAVKVGTFGAWDKKINKALHS